VDQAAGRQVRAIVTVAGRIVGAAPTFAVQSPWWADVEPVTAHLDAVLGTPTAVLRLVDVVGGESPRDGTVTYLVEVDALPGTPLEAADGHAALAPHPRRAPWAMPGGPAGILAWADAALAAGGRPRTGPAVQIKTWNLSCVHRLPTGSGPVWSKTTGAWASPESAAIALVAGVDPTLVPTVLAADPSTGRMLLDHIPGHDCWDADEATIRSTMARWVAAQAALAGHPGMAALADLRLATLPQRVAALLARDEVVAQLTAAERAAVDDLVAGLPALLGAVAAAGLPDTLVHGDFHPGNWRAEGGDVVVVDWSDSYLGSPALDVLRLRDWLPEERWAVAIQEWAGAWHAAVPGADPAAALAVLDPPERLHAACVYQRFLDNIEPDEWPYHQDDPAQMLRLAGAAYRDLLNS
jgi:hypothetical protein